jgi:uncharacterized protein YbcI
VDETRIEGTSLLSAVSNALVALHKEQFGRGPKLARSHFAGPDVLVTVLEDILLPAERKLVALGDPQRVRESRVAFQAATASDFVAAIEQIVSRTVRAFASGIDVEKNVVFETFYFEPQSAPGDGRAPEHRLAELGGEGA